MILLIMVFAMMWMMRNERSEALIVILEFTVLPNCRNTRFCNFLHKPFKEGFL